MRHKEKALTVLTETRLWINLVGDSKGFEGETARDKQVLISLMGKTSFVWTEEEELQREANSHDYGVSLIVFNTKEQKENYLRGIRTRNKNRNLKLRRKAA